MSSTAYRRHVPRQPDPRSWPQELIDQRNLAMAWALGQRVDPVARAAFEAWSRRARDRRR